MNTIKQRLEITKEKSNKTKFFFNFNNIEKPVASLTKKKREYIRIVNILESEMKEIHSW